MEGVVAHIVLNCAVQGEEVVEPLKVLVYCLTRSKTSGVPHYLQLPLFTICRPSAHPAPNHLTISLTLGNLAVPTSALTLISPPACTITPPPAQAERPGGL